MFNLFGFLFSKETRLTVLISLSGSSGFRCGSLKDLPHDSQQIFCSSETLSFAPSIFSCILDIVFSEECILAVSIYKNASHFYRSKTMKACSSWFMHLLLNQIWAHLRGDTTILAWVFPHQPLVKKIPQGLAYMWGWWRYFLSCGSLFPDPGLCQDGIKPGNTVLV